MNMRPTPGNGIKRLLHRLNTADAGAAWATFVDRYSPLIFKAIRQFEFEQDRAQDCYLYVCEKLCDDGFRRLLAFDTQGKARFRHWLGTVVFNLCVDWHRREFGRASLLPAITALPAFDQSVHRLYYQQGIDREACLQLLKDEFPDLTRAQLSEAIARVWSVLTPRQRWQLEVRWGRRDTRPGKVPELVDPNPEPDSAADRAQGIERLRAVLEKLTSEERLLLHLRYQQGLTYRQIATLTGLGDPVRANRAIKAAEQAAARQLQRLFEKNS